MEIELSARYGWLLESGARRLVTALQSGRVHRVAYGTAQPCLKTLTWFPLRLIVLLFTPAHRLGRLRVPAPLVMCAHSWRAAALPAPLRYNPSQNIFRCRGSCGALQSVGSALVARTTLGLALPLCACFQPCLPSEPWTFPSGLYRFDWVVHSRRTRLSVGGPRRAHVLKSWRPELAANATQCTGHTPCSECRATEAQGGHIRTAPQQRPLEVQLLTQASNPVQGGRLQPRLRQPPSRESQAAAHQRPCRQLRLGTKG